MDIRDLKIYDKVISPNGGIVSVLGMGKNVVYYGENKNCLADYLEPIPITDELLLKIGFKEVINAPHDGIDYELPDNLYEKGNKCYCKIWHTLLEDQSYVFNIHTVLSSKNILYVHQLQHELWDNNINIEIKL